jgi:hypothetical protein
MRRFSNGLAQSDLVRPEPASSGFVLFPLSLVSSSVKFSPLLLFVIPRFILLTMQDPFRYSAQSIPAFIWQLIWYNTLWSDWVTRVDSSDFDAIISKTLLVLEALAFGLIDSPDTLACTTRIGFYLIECITRLRKPRRSTPPNPLMTDTIYNFALYLVFLFLWKKQRNTFLLPPTQLLI